MQEEISCEKFDMGNNLHDSANKYDVIIEKQKSVSVESFQNGILVTFLMYYVFALEYPKSIEGTLETIQRLFLEICPQEGTKRASKTKKATAIHPKVLSLTDNIGIYTDSD
ncbi:Protein of unknown function [Cotesia congregata]|uniref:Uncharacterized protein n=1 Tax=Cotesia congregata TaxID=51543 RepID=A0A8J2H9M1_COTCN|nr:Protein of unknown function [Cotesia congregata]